MNTVLLEPGDVLFFRDGRPMSGSLSGHGAAWPLPTVVSHALHAALHRADLPTAFGSPVHGHDHFNSEGLRLGQDGRKFGSLTSAGPFPVSLHAQETVWFFPRPLDAGAEGTVEVTHFPLMEGLEPGNSSLPTPLLYPVARTVADKGAPRKMELETWWSAAAWRAFLDHQSFVRIVPRGSESGADPHFMDDGDFAGQEHTIGIGMDPETGVQDGERFYSASYLRLRQGFRLGVLAAAADKEFRHTEYGNDLVRALLNGTGARIVAGGQQRVCSALITGTAGAPLPLPAGKREGFLSAEVKGKTRWLVKWTLLTPAVWPKIEEKKVSRRGTPTRGHDGGWLPSWIDPVTGEVLLRTVSREERRRRRSLNYAGKGYETHEHASAIGARLVAAMTGKPVTVTGYALPHEAAGRGSGGAKSTHLAVPAGAVYYFAADSQEAAKALADALNWHGADTSGTRLTNRRSTLMGEKGFGLGVCGSWQFHPWTPAGHPRASL